MQIAADYSREPNTAQPRDEQQTTDLARLRRQFYDYLSAKANEIEEQKVARRYYHGSQWTAEEIAVLKKRKQPVVTSNRIERKINAVIGLTERLRQDPKAYPRTPVHEQGAELATAVLRFVLDDVEWKAKSPECARNAAIDGIAGIEYDLEQGDRGDPDLGIHIVDPDTFFYDPRSFRPGFADARFMGTAKWVDVDQAKEMVPEKANELDGLIESGSDLSTTSDREKLWINVNAKRVRMVDHWFIEGGKWRWCLYAAHVELMSGESPFIDEKGKTFPKFRMFASAVDQDGDRYGFVRNLKSPQDEINHRRSKALHILNSKRLLMTAGAVSDVETARREYARPDGVVVVAPGDVREKVMLDNQQADFAGQLQFLEESKTEIENFGPNPAVVGQGLQDSSGRAIALLQQAGISELGPYLLSYKQWKIRVYRDIWNIVQRHWTSERWVRVTDDDGLAQFLSINKLQLDPQTGLPAMVNQIGALDVDIILDEGPDSVNMMADNLTTLQSLGPAFAQEFPEVTLELAPLSSSVKKRMLDKIAQKQNAPPPPDPKVLAMQQQAQLEQQKAEADLALQARKAEMDAQTKQQQVMADIEIEKIKTAAQIQLEREKANAQLEIEHAKAMHQAHLSSMKADNDAEIARKKAERTESQAAA